MVIYGQRTADGRHRVRRPGRAVPLRVADRRPRSTPTSGCASAARARSSAAVPARSPTSSSRTTGAGRSAIPRDWHPHVAFDAATGLGERRRLRRRRRGDRQPRRAHARRPDPRPRHRPHAAARSPATDHGGGSPNRCAGWACGLARWPPRRADAAESSTGRSPADAPRHGRRSSPPSPATDDRALRQCGGRRSLHEP